MRQTPAHPGKRHLIGAAMALVAVTWLPGANAQTANWPNRPIKVVVPYGPGSSPDVIARIVGEKLSARLGDILSQMYLASATLKRYQDEGCQAAVHR